MTTSSRTGLAAAAGLGNAEFRRGDIKRLPEPSSVVAVHPIPSGWSCGRTLHDEREGRPQPHLLEAGARGEETAWEALATEPYGIEEEHLDAPRGLWLRPPNAVAGSALLAIHGGGFVSGSVATHARMFGHLARASGVATLAVEYGLVPDHVFPSQVDTVVAAYRWLLEQGATRIAVTGDSCGATLAIGLAVHARDHGMPVPAALLLMPAWTDFDDSRRLANRLRDAGVDVRLDEFADQLHTFQMTAGRTAVADDAVERAASWLRPSLTT